MQVFILNLNFWRRSLCHLLCPSSMLYTMSFFLIPFPSQLHTKYIKYELYVTVYCYCYCYAEHTTEIDAINLSMDVNKTLKHLKLHKEKALILFLVGAFAPPHKMYFSQERLIRGTKENENF